MSLGQDATPGVPIGACRRVWPALGEVAIVPRQTTGGDVDTTGAPPPRLKGTSAMAERETGAATLRIDEIAASTSRAVLEAVARINIERPELVVNPRIWFGIWVDIQHNFPGKGQFEPGAGPG